MLLLYVPARLQLNKLLLLYLLPVCAWCPQLSYSKGWCSQATLHLAVGLLDRYLSAELAVLTAGAHSVQDWEEQLFSLLDPAHRAVVVATVLWVSH